MTLFVRIPPRILAMIGLVLAVLLLTPAARAEQGWTGDWHGTLAIPGGELRLLLTISQSDDGALAAELESLDQAPGQKIPVSPIAIADGRLTFSIPAIGARYEGHWQPDRQIFSGTFSQGGGLPLDFARGAGESRPVIEGLDGAWRGVVNRNGVDLRLIVRIATGPGGTIAAFDAPDMMAMGLPVTGLTREGRDVAFTVPASGASFQGILSGDGARIAGTWRLPGYPDTALAFARDAAPTGPRARPQLPQPPFPYRTEEARFDNPRAPGVTLAGTLTVPEGEGPFPAAILISGSGPQDRDETVFGHKPFAVLADHLTRAGIAVLRYDDRGAGQSTGSHAGATSADFATDADAAFSWLADRPEIDARGVGFVGHSEGGLIGPLAALDNDRVAFLVLMAGPGTDTATLMESQRRAIGVSVGMSAADLDRSEPIQRRYFAIAAGDLDETAAVAALEAALTGDALAGAGIPAAQRDGMVQRMRDPWFRFFARHDPASVLARMRMPVLAINGALDRQVPAAENLAGIRAATTGNPDVTIVELPGLNHMFQTARTGGIGEYADIEETMAPGAMETITDWINARFPAGGH
ncbi:MAG: alpha/beta hydrolase [Sphingomonas sp.]|nr:alpha/beta hydrolase [Sphingomonas sp.]